MSVGPLPQIPLRSWETGLCSWHQPSLPHLLNTAVTWVMAETTTVHGPVPLAWQAGPCHPAKREPVSAVAVSTAWVPPARLALQVVPQLISPPPEVTRPVPEPDSATASMKGPPPPP